MAFNTNITPGAPPLLWSDVHDAFTKVNENFDILVATVGSGSGLIPINFETLDTSVSPATSNAYRLGDITHRWKSVHTSEWSAVAGSELNGLWAGSAQIKGIGLTVDLPTGSTVNGELIINPDKTFFKAAQVDNSESVVANEFSDTLNFLSGNGVQLTVDSSAESITIDNTGILSIADGFGISHATVSGVSTITNTGVRSLTSTTSLPSGRTAGAGININGSTGDGIKVTNTGILDVQAGFGITVSTDAASGISTVSFMPSVAPQTAFTKVHIVDDSPGNDLQSDGTADTFNIAQGYGILMSNNPGTDTLTITLDQTIDIHGSVFGKDSSLIVDSDTGTLFGHVYASTLRTDESSIYLGNSAGSNSTVNYAVGIGFWAQKTSPQGFTVAVGSYAGKTGQEQAAVAIGSNAGETNQGSSAIAIGAYAGQTNQPDGSIVLNATGVALNGSASGFFVDPVRSTANGTPLMYNSSTKELLYSNVLEFVGSKISTSDSSGLSVDVLTTFNTDVVIENDLMVAERLTVKGSRVINLSEIKSIVALSADFADFKLRMAALV